MCFYGSNFGCCSKLFNSSLFYTSEILNNFIGFIFIYVIQNTLYLIQRCISINILSYFLHIIHYFLWENINGTWRFGYMWTQNTYLSKEKKSSLNSTSEYSGLEEGGKNIIINNNNRNNIKNTKSSKQLQEMFRLKRMEKYRYLMSTLLPHSFIIRVFWN